MMRRRTKAMERLLRRVLVMSGATAVSGCCGLFASRIDERPAQIVKPLPAGVTTLAEDGCRAVCGENVRDCTVVDLELLAHASTVHCSYHYATRARVDRQHLPSEVTLRDDVDLSRVTDLDAPPLPLCQEACGRDAIGCRVERRDTARPGQRAVLCNVELEAYCQDRPIFGGSGRRPHNLAAAPGASPTATAAEQLAREAMLEAASVEAFRILTQELVHHGAPPTLIAWAKRAARDEARHARCVAELARRFGSAPTAPVYRPRGEPRDLATLARENAREGCVGETLAALDLLHRAEHAEDDEVRRLSRDIARDEASHAALAWAVHAWLRTRLTAGEMATIDAAIRRELLAAKPASQHQLLGDPPAARRRQLQALLVAELACAA